MITSEQVLGALRRVMHPEMKRNVVELHMISDVVVKDHHVAFTLVLPFRESPLKEDLVRSVRGAVVSLEPSVKVEVRLTQMSQQERAAFRMAAQGGPTPAQSRTRIDHVIAVLSGKGGVGKSSVSALLAVALQRSGKRVGVLDADITGPSIPKMFGLHRTPTMGSAGILPATTGMGIEVMSINLLLANEDEAVIWRGPLIGKAIKQFWSDVAWGDLDYLVVDLPPGTSDASVTVMQSVPLDGIVLVTSPQGLAGMIVRKAARMAERMGVLVLGLVENMSYITCPYCGEKIEVFGPSQALGMEEQLGVPLLGRLALDPELAARCDAGEIEEYGAVEFEPIAVKVAERIAEAKAVLASR